MKINPMNKQILPLIFFWKKNIESDIPKIGKNPKKKKIFPNIKSDLFSKNRIPSEYKVKDTMRKAVPISN